MEHSDHKSLCEFTPGAQATRGFLKQNFKLHKEPKLFDRIPARGGSALCRYPPPLLAETNNHKITVRILAKNGSAFCGYPLPFFGKGKPFKT